MASSAAVHSTPSVAAANPGASRWVPKTSEPGSPFSGLSRGRGRGGSRGGNRGGRGGGRGGFRGGKSQTDAIADKAPANAESPTTEKSSSSVPSKSSPAQSTNDIQRNAPRSKPPSRRASRAVPSLVIAPSPNVDGPPSGRSPNPRKRSGTNGKSPSSAGPKSSAPSGDEGRLRPGSKGRSPVDKDVPPHLRQTQGVRSDIDALVERVRAVAMAENRPSTPGTASHIDWAGDDDDTLPDLDDWGVTTTTAQSDKHNEISPIFVDGLRPLPEPIVFPAEAQDTPHFVQPEIPLVTNPARNQAQEARTVSSDKLVSKERSPIFSKASIEADSFLAASTQPAVAIPTNKPSSGIQPKENGRGFNRKTARHPLPPKPITVAGAATVPSKVTPNATPMRSQFTKTSPQEKASKNIDTVTIQPPTPRTEVNQPIVKLPDQGLSQSIHAPSPVGSTDTRVERSPETGSESTKADDNAPKKGDGLESLASSISASKVDHSLSASIHAPKPGESLSAPGSATIDSFKPTHTRAHTVGRPPHYNGPQRFPRSAATSPRSPFAPHHSRNHSSPPAGSTHRTHATRPVITGDAISRLARTIGTTTMTPSKSQPMPASKE